MYTHIHLCYIASMSPQIKVYWNFDAGIRKCIYMYMYVFVEHVRILFVYVSARFLKLAAFC
jgi:hypothetical protein